MNIIAILRSVPDALEELPLYEDQLDRDEVALKLNEFDDHALEEAVLLKEEFGATVIAVALDIGGDRMLQSAIARGADRAVKITGDFDEEASSRSMAPVYLDAAQQLDADLILTGVQTPEDMFGQLAPVMAALMNSGQANGVTSISLKGESIEATQEYEGGRSAVLSLSTPCILGVQAAKSAPRYISGTRLREAVQSAEIEQLSVTAQPAAEMVELVRLTEPDSGESARMLDDDSEVAADELIALFKERGFAS